MALLRKLSMRQVRALRHQTGVQYSDVEFTRKRAAIYSVFASAPHPGPASCLNCMTYNFSFCAQCLNVITERERSAQFYS